MSQETEIAPIAKKHVVYRMPGMEAVTVRRGIVYRTDESGALDMDLYYPPRADDGARQPVVVLVTGFADPGARRRLGCHFKDMGAFVSWARLIAASGAVAVTYVNTDPEADVQSVLTHLHAHAASLNVDAHRMAIWACSGHAPTALSVLMRPAGDQARGVALCYPYTLDLDGATQVAEASRQFGFVNACADRSTADLPTHVPLLIARAGADAMPGLNAALDRFIAQAQQLNLPLTVVNHASGPHGFDLFDDGEVTRGIIKQLLEFITTCLRT